MAKGIARKVRCIENGEVYNGYSEAGKAIGVTASCIRQIVVGSRKSAKGLHFEAVEESTKVVEVLPSTIQNEQEGEVPFHAFAVTNAQEVVKLPLLVLLFFVLTWYKIFCVL